MERHFARLPLTNSLHQGSHSHPFLVTYFPRHHLHDMSSNIRVTTSLRVPPFSLFLYFSITLDEIEDNSNRLSQPFVILFDKRSKRHKRENLWIQEVMASRSRTFVCGRQATVTLVDVITADPVTGLRQ